MDKLHEIVFVICILIFMLAMIVAAIFAGYDARRHPGDAECHTYCVDHHICK